MSTATLADLARPEIRALKPYASARAIADAAGILLNANENPYPPEGDAGLALNRYPDPQPAGLKARLGEIYGVASERLLITRGSDEGIDLLVRVFCRAGLDRVLICPPCFGMYALSARVQGGAVIEAPLVERDGDWQAPDDLVERAAGCRIAFLCSPNNPTGNLLASDTVEAVADAMAGSGLVVIDEAYIEFAPETAMVRLQQRHPNLVVLRTLSKAHALAGCRLGTVIADPVIIDLLRRIIAPYPLPTPTVAAALQALTAAALERTRIQLVELDAEKQRLCQALRAMPSVRSIWPGAANFVLIRAADGPGLVAAAMAAGIRLRDQSAQPALADCVRITIGTPAENNALIESMQRWTP
ncbi:MAG: histidinol-phosphate transaminase [Gammaproteobacteria bacterium HGW-Gammaproteobacteria-8]|nr:MAG: histidinol-phosphate transaminase [Gammaproteobacteria bacterium HGW-Gammaproteobacteria-8]